MIVLMKQIMMQLLKLHQPITYGAKMIIVILANTDHGLNICPHDSDDGGGGVW